MVRVDLEIQAWRVALEPDNVLEALCGGQMPVWNTYFFSPRYLAICTTVCTAESSSAYDKRMDRVPDSDLNTNDYSSS